MLDWFRSKALLGKDVQRKVAEHIKRAESKTSGEIRVFVEGSCPDNDPLQRARTIFSELKMDQTSARNAILLYLAVNDKKYALFGDVVIYEKAGGQRFWESAAQKMERRLREGRIADGICDCVDELGGVLAATFPYDPSVKKNELPDEIVFGKR